MTCPQTICPPNPTCAPCSSTIIQASCPARATSTPCPTCTTPVPATCPPLPPTTPAPPPVTGYGLIPCGTFVQYWPTNSSVVDNHGFSAGIYKDGTQSFVGLGINFGCANEYATPGRISTKTNEQGVYMSCTNPTYDNVATRFLINHPDLHWVKTNGSSIPPAGNFVKAVSSFAWTFYIGRTNLTLADGTSYTVVSKAFSSGEMLYSEVSGYTSTKNIEILSC